MSRNLARILTALAVVPGVLIVVLLFGRHWVLALLAAAAIGWCVAWLFNQTWPR